PVAYDLVEQSLVVLAGFSIALATLDRIHPAIDLLTIKFPLPIQIAMDRAYCFLGFLIGMTLAYALCNTALTEWGSKTTLVILPVSPAPFIFCLAIGFFLCGLVCLMQIFLPSEINEEKEEPYSE
ncbi:MAG: TRAP transporter small permease, partial [Syntrophaceae bacterium]|nr:TRAP transporter small permease [Syntrophaceae bacterium]